MKTIKILLILLLFIGFSSCKDELPPPPEDITIDDPTIDDPIEDTPDPIIEWKDTVMNPIQELSWLKEIVTEQESNTTTKVIIKKCTYDSTFGILINWCVDCPEELTQFFDYNGTILCESGGEDNRNTCLDFQQKSIVGKVLFETNPVVLPPCDWKTVDEIQPSDDLKEKLDSVFSKENVLVQNLSGYELIYVINNEQDFLKVCTDPEIASQIDFETQSIVWGRCYVLHIPDKISSLQLSECMTLYKYDVHIKKCRECFLMTDYLYYWGIYPRKINEEYISLIVKTTY